MKTLLAATALLATTVAGAHPGHGLLPGHLHANDVWGFAVLGVVVAACLWFRRDEP